MPDMHDTLNRLTGLRTVAAAGRLLELSSFGSNPGLLNARTYLPPALPSGAPLVVVLHGCTQTAAAYDQGAGWSQMADELGFALLLPEQQRRNNPNLCFNWFLPEDIGRGGGEALSIRQMIGTMITRYAIDPARIFVTGLSAGGAMTAVMLAAYPEIFAGGAIIAGLPYGCASTIPQALERMRGSGLPRDADLARRVRRASDHGGPWPKLSVWHGSADATVDPANAKAIVGQWRALHAVDARPTRTDIVHGCSRQVWHAADGRAVIEQYTVPGLGHGTPLATVGAKGCGVVGPHMLEAGISSTRHICTFWGLANEGVGHIAAPALPATQSIRPERIPLMETAVAPSSGKVGQIIEDALRAAGLMR